MKLTAARRVMTTPFGNDRAAVLATAILQIITSLELESIEALHLQLTQFLRDEIADLTRQIAADQEPCDE